MRVALTREVGPSLADCELTHLQREPIDVARARAQHHAYEDALSSLGCEVKRIAAEPSRPDAVFVEDTAIVLDEVAVITRPGAASRRPEIETTAEALAPFRTLLRIMEPATLDGGDVLRLGRHLFVGLSSRSGEAAVRQLQDLLAPFDYEVSGIALTGCLHLKSAVTEVAPGLLLLNPKWVEARNLGQADLIEVDPVEPSAANALAVGGAVVFPAGLDRTARRLESAGLRLARVDVSELARAEGGVTCCSLIFETSVRSGS